MDYESIIDSQIAASSARYLAEVLKVPNQKDGMNKMRHTMPQISKFDDFMDDLKANDIEDEVRSLSAKKLTPTQGNFSEEKVDRMIESGVWKEKPIITSSDDYVIDGHHRWLAAAKLDKDIKARVIDMSAEDLLAFLKDKPYVETKKISE